MEKLYVVRLFDGFDFEWFDVSEPVLYEEAQKIWNEHTKNGTEKKDFDDIDYYEIFPADTVMKFSEKGDYGTEKYELDDNGRYKRKV